MKTHIIKKIRTRVAEHKILTSLTIIILIAVGYFTYRSTSASASETEYSITPVRIGTITETVTGSGQVSASNQTDILSQVSGTIRSIDVSVGQAVRQGQLIATIDSTDAAIDLENARISFQKLTSPAKEADVANAKNALDKAYNDAFNAATSAYLDLPDIMAGMKELLYGRDSYLSEQDSSSLTSIGRMRRATAAEKYDTAAKLYQSSLEEFSGITRSSPASSIEFMIANTIKTMRAVSEAATETQNTVTFLSTNQPEYKTNDATAAKNNASSWTSQSNSDLISLVSAENSLQSNKSTFQELQEGADPLDIQSSRLSLGQKQKAYDNYFIRAPYDGIIGRIPVSVYGQAGGSTVMATIIGAKKIATISLNEIDAAKVKEGQKVAITFDAIDGLTATGTVSQVDQIGTVSSGVVSYSVKIAIETADTRIKPGMSVNTAIVTNQKPDVLVVPSSAIKKQGNMSFVQIFDKSALPIRDTDTARQSVSSTTRRFGAGTNRTISFASATPPRQVAVTIGASDDMNSEIVSGLTSGDLVVTKTASTGAQSTTAPSILNSLGGQRPAGGVRIMR